MGVKGNSPRPRARPGNAAGEVAAMAGGKEVDGARGLGARSHETRNKLHGEKEGSTAKLTARKIGVVGGSKMVVRAEGRTADPGDLRLGSYSFRARRARRKRAGNSRGTRGGSRLPFKESAERGDAPTTRSRAAVAQRLDRALRLRKEGERADGQG